MLRRWLVMTMTMTMTAVVAMTAALPAWGQEYSRVCVAEALRQERAQAIPAGLLAAIALVESGRWDAERRESFAWPWTVTAEGRGRFLPTKAAAIAEVLTLRARGVRNIDVGCMQINLMHHPDAFASLGVAFEPAANIAYAARFLVDLRSSDGSWPTAAAHYHSRTPERAAAYRGRVMEAWDAQRRRADDGQGTVVAALAPAASVEPAAAKRFPAGGLHAERSRAQRAAEEWRRTRTAEYLRRRHAQATARP